MSLVKGQIITDTHEFDRFLVHYPIEKVSTEDKGKIFRWFLFLIEKINPEKIRLVKDRAIIGLNLIYKTGNSPPNYYANIKLYADDLLCNVIAKIYDVYRANKYTINILEKKIPDKITLNNISSFIANKDYENLAILVLEQLHDMIDTNGTCPQGRVNRFLQLYVFFNDLPIRSVIQ